MPDDSVAVAGPMKVGGALATPRSRCQSAATRPRAASSTITPNRATITSDTMPTRSRRRRFHAEPQIPSTGAVI